MLIISGIKDYYDHCVSYYGIDKHVVYDRKETTNAATYGCLTNGEWLFDAPKKMTSYWVLDEKGKVKRVKEMKGKMSYFILEIGTTHYLFECERYLDDNKISHCNERLVYVKEDEKKLVKDCPLAIIDCNYYFNHWEKQHKVVDVKVDKAVKNPILRDTFIPSYIEPSEVFLKIYNYLLSIKDKPIVDKRNDVQKLEGYGFDKKSSFRHPIK